MKNKKQIKRIDIDQINLSYLLLQLKEYGFPFIITPSFNYKNGLIIKPPIPEIIKIPLIIAKNIQ